MARLRILLVEREEHERLTLRSALEEQDYQVEEAITSEVPLWRLRKAAPPDLLVTTFPLPLSGGDQFIAVVRQDPDLASIPVLALTRERRTLDEMRAAAAGADGHCPRPIDTGRFVAQVRRMIGRSSSE